MSTNNIIKSFPPDSQILEEVIRSGNIPCHGRSGMLCSGGGLLPPALLNESKVPKYYLEMISNCGAHSTSALPNTALVYNLMISSGLPKDVLSYIWSAVNRNKPGQLTRQEFFSLLALIALAQKDESLASLCTMDSLPIPYFNTVQAFPSAATNTTSTSSATFFDPFAKIKQTTSSFIPTALLSRKSIRRKKDKNEEQKKTETDQQQEDPNDLVLLDFGTNSTIKDGGQVPTDLTNWQEVIHAVYLIFQEANNLLGKAQNGVLEEVFSTEEGESYLRSLSKAIKIVERVNKSSGKYLPLKSVNEVEACRNCWKKYSKFLNSETPEESGLSISDKKCAICSQPVTEPIDYSGQTYDLSCANLWINNVSSVLPNLHVSNSTN